MSLSKLGEIVKDRKAWQAAVHGVTKSWTWLINWTTYWISFTSVSKLCPICKSIPIITENFLNSVIMQLPYWDIKDFFINGKKWQLKVNEVELINWKMSSPSFHLTVWWKLKWVWVSYALQCYNHSMKRLLCNYQESLNSVSKMSLHCLSKNLFPHL